MRVLAWGSNLFGQLGTEGLTHAAPVDLGHERVIGMSRAAIVRGSGEDLRCLVGVDQVVGKVNADGRAWHGGAVQCGSPPRVWRSAAADLSLIHI